MIKYRIIFNDVEKFEAYCKDNNISYRWAGEAYTHAFNILLGNENSGGLISSFDFPILYTREKLLPYKASEITKAGMYLREMDQRLEIKDRILSCLAEELSNTILHDQFDDISKKLYDTISGVKQW